jgi:chromosome segregation ATPase
MEDNQNDSRTSQEHPSTQLPPHDNRPPNTTPEVTEPSRSNQEELTIVSLQLQALERQKDILAKQLATQQNMLQRANQLAEAKRKVAAMQAEIDKMQQECASTQTNHEQPPQHPPIGASHQNEVHI